MAFTESQLADYQALTQGIGLVVLPARTVLRVTGEDRANFLHNFCTNDVRRLPPGGGCEAFITSVQGKTLAHGGIYCEAERMTLETVASCGETLMKHLGKYLLADDVELADDSAAVAELLLAGPHTAAWLAERFSAEVPHASYGNQMGELFGVSVILRRVPWTPSAWLIECATSEREALIEQLKAAGAATCDETAWQAVRIEQGWPEFGHDITDANLPQEVGRDEAAISFVKGCYLGQETVARLDALGHVNKILRGLKFSGATIPAVGTLLTVGGKEAARVTSASYSPALAAPLALGYVRRGHATPGTRIETDERGPVEVLVLPVVVGD